MSARRVHGIFHDEQGDWSAARVLLTIALGFTFGCIVGALLFGKDLPEPAWHLLEAVLIALASWAGAPRVARYFKRERKQAADTDVPESA